MNPARTVQRTYYLILSLFWFGVSLPMALSVLLLQQRGLNLFQVGLLTAVYSVTIVLLEVPTGSLADTLGRKRVALLAYGFIAAASAVFLFSFSFPIFLLSFVLNGIGRALSSGALDAWFVDTYQEADPEAELQPALAKAGTFVLLALGSGTLLGSVVPNLFAGLSNSGVLTPLSMTVLFSSAFHLVTLAATFLLVQEEHPAHKTGGWQEGFRQVPAMASAAFRISRSNPTVLLLFAATLVSGLSVVSMEVLWQPRFAHLLGSGEENTFFFGVVMGGNFVVGMVGNMLSTRISRLFKQQYGLVCALFQGLRGATLIFLALQTAVPLAVLLFWLVYLNLSVVNSPHSTLMNREIPRAQRSSILSIGSLVGYVGSIVGSAGLGYLAEQVSISAAWIVSGTIVVISLFLYLRIHVIQKGSYEPQVEVLEAH